MVCLVRSEDRKPSRRVFPLLQNLDLDTVTFAQVQSTGDPISIEDMNEQEMVDLIIVNLARLAVAGEWTGLLEAGGGSFNAEIADGSTIDSQYALNRVDVTPPWGVNTGNNSQATRNEPIYYPFIAPKTGDVTGVVINISSVAASAVNFLVAVYSDDGGLPNAKLGEAEFDAEVSGQTEQTSLSATISLVRGTQYWIGVTRSASVAFNTMVGSSAIPWSGPTENLSSTWMVMWEFDTNPNTLVDTITKTDLSPRGYVPVSVGLNI